MHEVFGHSLKVKYFTYRSISSIWILATIVNMKIISEIPLKKDKKCSVNLKKVRKKYNRSRSLKIISKNEFLGGKVEVDFRLLHSIIWLLIKVFPGTKDQCNTEAEHSVWKGLVSRDP